MKKIKNVFLCAAVASVACACSVKEDIQTPEIAVKYLTAYTDSEITKTQLDGVDVKWENGDAITVFDNTGAKKHSDALSAFTPSTSASFAVAGLTNDVDVAIYPKNDKASYSQGNKKVSTFFPSVQNARANGFGQGANIAVAVGGSGADASNLNFCNIGAILALTINSDDASNIAYINLSAKEVLAGPVDIDIDDLSVTKNGVSQKSISVQGDFSTGSTYYFVVLPGTYTGLTITFVRKDGYTASYTNEKTLVVSRNDNKRIGTITINQDDSKWTAPTTYTVSYSVASTSLVNASGDEPAGSSSSYSSTYSNAKQLTAGKKMTLTLDGFKGKVLKGLTLSMRSNASAGAGYLSMNVGSTSIATIGSSGSGVAFDNSAWNGAYSAAYVDVDIDITEHLVKVGESIVIVIGATTNSLYCDRFDIHYIDEPAPTPDSDFVAGDGTEVKYTLTTPTSNGNSAYATYYDIPAIDGIKWKAPGNQSTTGFWRIGGKSLSNTERYIYSKDAMTSEINKVIVYTNGVSNTNLNVNSVKLDVYSTAAKAAAGGNGDIASITKSQSEAWPKSTATNVDFEKEDTSSWKNCFYRITFNLTNSTASNYGVDLNSVVFYY